MLRPEITEMTMEQFLLDTILYFSVNPKERRCTKPDSTICSYQPHTDKTQGCAIGRFIDTDTQKEWDKCGYGIVTIIRDPYLNEKAPAWMKKFDSDFLYECQKLHDNEKNWDSGGLTDMGKRQVNYIVNRFNLKFPLFNL